MLRLFSPPVASDIKIVVDTASVLHVSEFDVFRLAYEKWFGHPAESQELDRDFSRYMNREIAPMWVRAFARQVSQSDVEGRLDVREFGVEPPPPTTYWTAFLGGMSFAFIVMIVALLVYFAVPAEDAAGLACRFPPCY
jgi:hypothetical protein